MGKSYAIEGFAMYTVDEPFTLTETLVSTRNDSRSGLLTNDAEEHAYRDSAGRFRLEVGSQKNGAFLAQRVTIFDPVALTLITFAPGSKTATLTHLGPRTLPTAEDEARKAEQAARSAEYRRTHPGSGSEEPLPSRVIAGEQGEGMRRVSVYPGSDGVGEKRVTVESWTSPDLKLRLLEKIDDPQGTDRVRTVTQLQRGEPDAGLFKLPEGMVAESATRVANSPDLYKIGGDVTAPIALFTPEPEFTEQARKAKVSGNVLIGLRIEADGRTSSLRVIRGMGYGLDEKALEAVSKYKFRPAMRAGVPVAVEINIEVNFKIYQRP